MADDPESLMKRISAMQKALANFRIIGGEGVTVHGSMEHGYAVSVDGGEEGGGAAGGGGGGPATGACCIGADCHILTAADCATMGGTYQGDSVPCAPDPCSGICCEVFADGFVSCDFRSQVECEALVSDPVGTFHTGEITCLHNPLCGGGGCCFGDGSCLTYIDESTCNAQGGSFLGLGVECPDGGCPTCPVITLVCDSISASKTKCGFIGFVEGKTYLTQVEVVSINQSCDMGVGINPPFDHCVLSATGAASRTSTYNHPACEETINGCTVTEAGTSSSSASCRSTGACSSGFDSCDIFTAFSNSSGSTTIGCSFAQNYDPTNTIITFPDDGTKHVSWKSWCSDYDAVYEVDLSDEYLTADLISETEAILPSYSGTYVGGVCASSRDLSTDENTYSIERSKPRFEFTASTVAFTIRYNEHFVPLGGGSPTDIPRTLSVGAGITQVDGPEILEPLTNGTITVEDITCAVP